MRLLSPLEVQNLSWFSSNNVSLGYIEVTKTGLEKSILDATSEFRYFLAMSGLHDFAVQRQGPENKSIIDVEIWVTEDASLASRVSLYRPVTKNGDPRFWITNLRHLANPGDIVAMFLADGSSHVLNLTQSNISQMMLNKTSSLAKLLTLISLKKTTVRESLLSLIGEISQKGWLKAEKQGSTAIGHLLETELGIQQNSSAMPDFHGVEIKSSRHLPAGDKRFTLFAKVPDWEISAMKSSREILNAFGYQRGLDKKLYCTVSGKQPNSQGLYFTLDDEGDFLFENSKVAGLPHVAAWSRTGLESKLTEKHSETFWVNAEEKLIRGEVHFFYRSVTITSNPVVQQFLPLVREGLITMDHLIKLREGKVTEKGPLFKLRGDSFPALFPSLVEHRFG